MAPRSVCACCQPLVPPLAPDPTSINMLLLLLLLLLLVLQASQLARLRDQLQQDLAAARQQLQELGAAQAGLQAQVGWYYSWS